MADEDIPEAVETAINESINEPSRKKVRKKKREPVYKVIGASKIPVAKAHGPVWMSRKSMAEKATEEVAKAWNEAMKYNAHAQLNQRT